MLVVVYVVLLLVVAATLTSGGTGGAANPFAGAVFLSFLAALGGVFAALHASGLMTWVGTVAERHQVFSAVTLSSAVNCSPSRRRAWISWRGWRICSAPERRNPSRAIWRGPGAPGRPII